jgi:hypothetical protein
MADASASSDGPSSEGESIIERAMRGSLGAFPLSSKQAFSKDEHLQVARSGAADLSGKEAFSLFEKVHSHTESLPIQHAKRPRPVPLFFGHWSGMNPFRYVKPFFLSGKNKQS